MCICLVGEWWGVFFSEEVQNLKIFGEATRFSAFPNIPEKISACGGPKIYQIHWGKWWGALSSPPKEIRPPVP